MRLPAVLIRSAAPSLAALLLLLPRISPAVDAAPEAMPVTDPLSEIVIAAPEPRFVAPTRRDRIGRIWAPVYINEQGPFRLVLDSGANHSGIALRVAEALGLPLNQQRRVLLRGVTGSTPVATVNVNSLSAGDIWMGSTDLPIVTDALGGADGILGTDKMADRRVVIDFRHDMISITRSHNERPTSGFQVIPFRLIHGNLLAVNATVAGIRTIAIIDTGGQVTIANPALRSALEQRRARQKGFPDKIEGVTTDVQDGDAMATPPLRIPSTGESTAVIIRFNEVTYGAMDIFQHWHMMDEPAMLIGMDALGLLDTLIIDYRRHELQVRMPSGTLNCYEVNASGLC
jgi:hypothetical protein